MKKHWLCNDVMGFLQCANCLRNPEHETNQPANPNQPTVKPLTSRHGCADQLTDAGSAKGKADA